jgi:2-haloacid dehalogenase
MAPPPVQALLFDVFGTVVDWRTTILREGALLSHKYGWRRVNWASFAAAWRAEYAPAMDRVRRGELPWTNLDELHRMILIDLLPRFIPYQLDDEQIDHLNRVWHRLLPWRDSVGGINRLRTKYIVAALSNGNVAMLVNMAKHAGLTWDCILSAELFRRYKPDLEVYRMAAELLGLPPDRVLMVAAHNKDLTAAQQAGLRTAFVIRRSEYGPRQTSDMKAEFDMDIVTSDLYDLAEKLGA